MKQSDGNGTTLESAGGPSKTKKRKAGQGGDAAAPSTAKKTGRKGREEEKVDEEVDGKQLEDTAEKVEEATIQAQPGEEVFPEEGSATAGELPL